MDMEMDMKSLETLRGTLCRELEDISKKREIDKQLLDNIYKLTGSVHYINKIMRESGETEYSRAGGWEAHGMYDDGNSYRGMRDMRDRHSRDNMRGGDYRDGHSRGGSTLDMLEEMLDGADSREREAIMRCMKEIKN